jgi:hypothetical protein
MEKLLIVVFIYLVPLIEWVSNPIPIDKKKRTIHVCMDFRYLKKSCTKVKFPSPFIDHIIDKCVGSKVFSFMDGFLGYNQIQIKSEDQLKTTFIFPWGKFV